LKIQDTEEGTGVKVLDVEAASAAATAGLMKDDVITEIGGVKVTNTDEARTFSFRKIKTKIIML
jgi:serine protease Do